VGGGVILQYVRCRATFKPFEVMKGVLHENTKRTEEVGFNRLKT